MDTILDNVLLTYVSYGLVLTSGKPEVLRAVSATFSEKEVADAKDVLWTQCLDHLGENPIEILPLCDPERWQMYLTFWMLWMSSVTSARCPVV